MLPRTSAEINSFLEARGLAPLARFGQNFLVHAASVELVAAAGGPIEGRVVLEIGPGLGALTSALLARGARVVAAEVDAGYCGVLRDAFASETHFTLIEGDCLGTKGLAAPLLAALSAAGAWDSGFFVISNLPYQISSPFLAALPHLLRPPESVVLTLQKEVARALRAKPGSEHYTPLSLLAGLCYEVEQLRVLPAGYFHPRPEVESAVVRLVPRDLRTLAAGFSIDDLDSLLLFARTLLGARRQILRRTLPRAAAVLGVTLVPGELTTALLAVGLTGNERADVLEIPTILRLFAAVRGAV